MKFIAEIFYLNLKPSLPSAEWSRFEKFVEKVKGKRVFITLETETKSRSNQQNRYYWGVVIDLLSEHTGYTQNEMHEVLKHKYLRRTLWIHTKRGFQEQSIITKSTTELTTKEMEDYLSQIRVWASADLGVFLPEPNESNYAI